MYVSDEVILFHSHSCKRIVFFHYAVTESFRMFHLTGKFYKSVKMSCTIAEYFSLLSVPSEGLFLVSVLLSLNQSSVLNLSAL